MISESLELNDKASVPEYLLLGKACVPEYYPTL